MAKKQAALMLEDGTLFRGESMGLEQEVFGEVVFNTAMVGYQEILTDPACHGEIVVMTYPLMGNTGFSPDRDESDGMWAKGLVVKELCDYPSHWNNSVMDTDEYLSKRGVSGIQGLDTRAVALHIREYGSMIGVLSTVLDKDVLFKHLERHKRRQGDLVRDVTPKPYRLEGHGKKVAVVDLGAKRSMIKALHDLGCDVYGFGREDAKKGLADLNPDGILISSGPGDPERVEGVRGIIETWMGKKPMLGVGLGYQLMGLVLGGETRQMIFGHHGVNHPVRCLKTGKLITTSQNHNYVLEFEDVKSVETTYVNLNDQTLEGFAQPELSMTGVQFYPETVDNHSDTDGIYKAFVRSLED